MLARSHCATVVGIQAFRVEVEVDVAPGLPKVTLVGLPDAAVKESKERVKAAVVNAGYRFPDGVITINLAPADIKKEGPVFDLAIALALLKATQQIYADHMDRFWIVGELALDGSVRPVRGILPMALEARKCDLEGILVPEANAREASVADPLNVFSIASLRDAAAFLEGQKLLQKVSSTHDFTETSFDDHTDFSDVKGQEFAKSALEIAVAGGHNLLMIGPPGSGKSMLAKRIPTIMPRLTLEEALETTKIHSVAGLLKPGESILNHRPFRSPHHTISDVGLIGGSANPSPGEVSLAHNGVLFLDELPEFKRSALEVLRQPLEDGHVTISRAAGSLTFPARFMLVAAMNPTVTGSMDDIQKGRTTVTATQRYLNKISGPLLDRIDIHLEVTALKHEQMLGEPTGEKSSTIRERVERARAIQRERFARQSDKRHRIWCNAQMGAKEIRAFANPDEGCKAILKNAMTQLNLSARAYDRILKVARTIADLREKDSVGEDEISSAILFRNLDRQLWA